MRYLISLALGLGLVLLPACSGTELRRFEPANLFALYQPADLLTDRAYKTLLIEPIVADVCAGAVSSGDLDGLIKRATAWVKKREVKLAPTVTVAGTVFERWSDRELREYTDRHAKNRTHGDVLVMHVLYVPGQYKDAPETCVAVAFSAHEWAMFPDAYRTAPSTPFSILVHEFGHCLGLANNGTPAVRAKHAEGGHCTNAGCVMLPAAPPGWNPDYCGDCQADLHAYK